MKDRRSFCLLAGAALAVTLLVIPARADDPVRWRDGRISIHVTDVPLGDVLKDIAKATQAEIRGKPEKDRRVSAQLDDVTLSDALERIVGRNSFSLVYGDEGLRAIELLDSSTSLGLTATPTTLRPAAEGATPPTGKPLETLLADHPRLELTPRLAQMTAEKDATLRELVRIAVHAQDRAARVQASRMVLKAVRRDADLRASVRATIAGWTDETVDGPVRLLLGGWGESLIASAQTPAEQDELRQRCAQMIRRLKAASRP